MLIVSNHVAVAGLGFLAVAMTGVVTLVTGYLFGAFLSAVATAFVAAMFFGFWYVLPSAGASSAAGNATVTRAPARKSSDFDSPVRFGPRRRAQ